MLAGEWVVKVFLISLTGVHSWLTARTGVEGNACASARAGLRPGRTLFAGVQDSKDHGTLTAESHRLQPGSHHLGRVRRECDRAASAAPRPVSRPAGGPGRLFASDTAREANRPAPRERKRTAKTTEPSQHGLLGFSPALTIRARCVGSSDRER